MLCYEVVAAWLNPFLQRLTHIMIRWLIATNYPNKNNYAARLLFKMWAWKEIAKSYRTDVSKNLRNPAVFSLFFLTSPRRLPHFFICQAAQLLALSPPAQDPLDFFPAKELCTVPKPRLLTSARPFPFLSLQLAPVPPTPALPSNLHISVHSASSINPFRAVVDSSASFGLQFIYQSSLFVKGKIILKYNNISVSVCHLHFCFSAQADWQLLHYC